MAKSRLVSYMQNKVVFLRYIPLTQKIEHDFYIRELVDNGISVEYWDLSQMFDFIPSNLEVYKPTCSVQVKC